MAAITWADVVVFESELATVPLAAQAEILALVHEVVGVKTFGGENARRTRMARIYLAAHNGALWLQVAAGNSTGAETSMSGGGLSISMAAPQMTADGMTRTAHGQRYLHLVRNAPLGQGFTA
jgi:hypothetical protein